MKKYIKKYMTVLGLAMVLLFSLCACGKEDTSAQDEEEIEEIEEDGEIEEDNELISGDYTPESNKFTLKLPKGNWKVEREEEGNASLQAEDEQSYFEIMYLSAEDAQNAMGEIPATREELEEQISYGEVHPTITSFETKTEDGVKQTIYALKYTDGDYPYMIQGNYEKNGEFFTVIVMTKQEEESFIGKLQESLEKFKILD